MDCTWGSAGWSLRSRPASASSRARPARAARPRRPRKGLDPKLTEYLRDRPLERFIYVSCGLASFRDDTARLTALGKLRLSALTTFNLLPYTEHVETVACFERSSGAAGFINP